MQSMKFVLPLMLALVVSSYVSAEDAKPVAKEEVLTGKLSEKAKDAKEGVVACLKSGDKMVCLWTKDEALVKALTEGAKAGAEVKVTCTHVDADNVSVTKCDPVKAAEKPNTK